MGVEYRHFLIPEDPCFVPANGVFAKVDAVLAKWGLKEAEPKFYDLTNGTAALLQDPIVSLTIGHGIGLKYEMIEGSQVEVVAGKSYYPDVTDEERYFQQITFIAGTDFRIHPSGEELWIDIVKGPIEDDVELEIICEYDKKLYTHAEAYACSEKALPPVVNFSSIDNNRIINSQSFAGYWRTSLVIDFGKDLPDGMSRFYELNSKEFTKNIEEAFGCKLIQIGEFY